MKPQLIIYLIAALVLNCCSIENVKRSSAINADYEKSINEQFQIDLPSNPTTGYSWKWTNKRSVTIVDSIGYQYIPDNPTITGKGGKEIWKFKGKEPGIDTIKFEYCRPWDSKSIARSKIIIIKIK